MFFFHLFKGKKVDAVPVADEDDGILPQIRKPQHALRDARMSVPVAEREYFEMIQARRASAPASLKKGKAKMRSPLAYDSGMVSTSSTPATSASNESQTGSRTDLTPSWWDTVYERAERARQDSTAPNSVGESSKAGPASKELETKINGTSI